MLTVALAADSTDCSSRLTDLRSWDKHVTAS
jgi:hypothetical protein